MFNNATFIGNVGRDNAELRFTGSNKPVTSFSLAVNESYRDASGELKQNTVWVKCTAWGKLAESIAKNVTAGRKLFVSGPVDVEAYKANNGDSKATLVLTVREIRYLDSTKTDENENESEVSDETQSE